MNNTPKVGDKRWSDYFSRHVYLVEYITDDEWYFKFDYSIRAFQSQTPWSEMSIENKKLPP
jgi:hypothetical protein